MAKKKTLAEMTPEERKKLTVQELAELRGIPYDRFVNAGDAPIIVPDRGESSTGGSKRLESGQYVDGDYYEQCLGKVHGFVRMATVDDKRLKILEKRRAVHEGEELPDWVKEVHAKKGTDAQGTQSVDAVDAMMGEDAVSRLAQAHGAARPHAADEK